MAVNQSSIYSLPVEMQCRILRDLEKTEDFEVSSSVCKLWHDIIRTSTFQVIIKELKLKEHPGKYSARMQELVNFICSMSMHVELVINVNGIISWRKDDISPINETLNEYELKLKKLYQVFKEKAVIQHNDIDSYEFISSVKAVRSELEAAASSSKGGETLTSGLVHKIDVSYHNFYSIAFKDVIQACACNFKTGGTQNLFNQKIKFLNFSCESFLHFDDKIPSALKSFISKNRNEYRMQLKSTIEELEKEQDSIKVRLNEVKEENDAANKEGNFNICKKLVTQFQIGGRSFMLSQRINALKSEYDAIAEDEFQRY